MARRRPFAPDDFSTALEEMLVDAHGDDEQLWAMLDAISEALSPPIDGFVMGEPVTLAEVDYDGNERRGLGQASRRVATRSFAR